MSEHSCFNGGAGENAELTEADVLKALAVMYRPGDIVEMRCPGSSKGTIVGYFDDMAALASQAHHLSYTTDLPAVYVGLNPCPPEVKHLGGGLNRFQYYSKSSMQDHDIPHRRRLLVDIDAEKPLKDVMATEAERHRAQDQARAVREFLTGHGFPGPMFCDSGNGGHLLYALDLPNELFRGTGGEKNNELARKFLAALKGRFPQVDSTTFNPARITKLYGTMVRKGAGVDDRPHRASRVLEAPDLLEAVPRELMESIVGEKTKASSPGLGDTGDDAPTPAPDADVIETMRAERDRLRRQEASGKLFRSLGGDLRTLDIRGLWAERDLDVYREAGDRIELLCPWHDEHTTNINGGTCVFVKDGDYPRFSCRHDHCTGRKLDDVLSWFGPEAMDRHCGERFRGDPDPTAEAPEIIVGNRQLPDLTADAVDAIEKANDPPRLFRRSGVVVRMRHDDEGVASCEALSDKAVKGELARAASWKKWAGSGEKVVKVDTMPPDVVVDDLLTFTGWKLPALDRIIDAPVFAADGRLIDRPGYDAPTRLWYEPGAGLDGVDVPVRPSREQVRAAVSLLADEMLGEFPFTTPGDKANCLAFFLLPAVRAMIGGPTPMHVIEATRQGTGKSRLGEMWGLVWLGRLPSMATECHDDDEWSKTLGAALLSGSSYFFVDNVKYALKSGSLAAALTSGSHRCRMLGASRMVDLPVKWVWMVTGNNIKADSDITRRFVRSRLDAQCEQPHLRTFRIKDILGWVRSRRSALVSACLTIVRAWIDAGRPAGGVTFGSYEEWSRTMGGILEHAGVVGFLDNLGDSDEVNTQDAEWRAFVHYWGTAYRDAEITVRDVHEMALETDMLLGVMGDGREPSQRTKLGIALNKRAGQIWGGWKITLPKDEDGRRKFHRKGGAVYQLIPVAGEPAMPNSPQPHDDRHLDGPAEEDAPEVTEPATTTTTTSPYRFGDWITTTLLPEPVRIMALAADGGFHVGFMDNREFSVDLGDRVFRVEGRPRVRVGVAEITGRVEAVTP